MKHTECKDCELSNGDCGLHFEMDGVTNYDIPSLGACDQYGNCMLFKPKAKTQDDLISREALKAYARKVICGNNPTNSLIIRMFDEIIDNAPAVELVKGEWIPVSERLPKEEDYRPCYGLPDGCVMWQTDNGVIGFGWYYDSTKCWSDIYDHPITAGKVIAWQPLPEPYKEGEAKECI